MAESLKDATSKPLLVVMAANVAVFYAAVQTGALFSGDWLALLRNWAEALPGGLGIVLTGIVNAQLTSEAKARLVFWRWRDPLPGCEAFSRHAGSDSRIDLTAIERAHGPLPTDPKQQNALWYRLYRLVGGEPAVTQVHRSFLFARDYTCISALILIVLGPIGLFEIPSLRTALIYIAMLGTQYIVARQAARNHGCRFVTTVLALSGARAA